MTSIFLAERWSRIGDSVSALNCQLASLAAQNRQKKICCVVLKATEEEKKDATGCGVELILPSLGDDITDACENDEPCYKWLLSPDQYFSTLTNLQSVEYIVEHVKSLTSFLCASVLRNRCFKDADIVLINHETPSADLRDRHLKFAEAAGTVFSVKPTVFEEYTRLYQMTKIKIKHELYLPRPEKTFFDLNVDQMSKKSHFKQILTVITDKKVESSRFRVLSAAVGKTADGFKFMHAKIPKWFVRITSAADLSDTANFLNNNLNSTYIEPNTYPPYGCQDEIYRDLQQSNVLVIPPDEPFRMEALWAIAAGLPVLVPRRTPMAEFLEKYFGERAEYFLYEPSVDDLSAEISKMLNRTEAIGVTRKLKDAFKSHPIMNGSHENFTARFNKQGQSYPQPVSVSSPPHRQSTDDGIGSIEDTSSQQSLSPQPVSPGSPVFSEEASTSQDQSAPVIARKRPLMPTLLCEANLEFEEKKMKMETAHLMERERQQLELKKERDQQQFKTQKREALLAEIKELYELEKKLIIARNSADLVKELDEAYDKFKARLDAIIDGSLQFMLSFLSEQDIDYFWQKYMAADVEHVISGILITPEMRSMAEEAGVTARIKLKIDKKEFELVKEILHDISAVYTAPQKIWMRTTAYGEWEKYLLNHVEENQAKYLIEQSRYHHIISQLRFDEFFFPSVVSYWYRNCYTLPSTLTEATEWAIMHHFDMYCEKDQLKIGNVQKVMRDSFCKIGKSVFGNIFGTGTANLTFVVPHIETYLFGLLEKTQGNKYKFINELLSFYAAAIYLSRSQYIFLDIGVIEVLVKSFPIVLYFVSSILNVKADFFFSVLTNCVMKTYPVTFKLFSLQGGCLLETKYPENFLRTVHSLMIPHGLNLSQTDLESISLYDIEAVEFLLKNTSLIQNIMFDFVKPMPCELGFLKVLNQLVANPTSSIGIKVKNSVELYMVARYIAFHRLFTTQKYKSSRGFSKPDLQYINIEATQNKSGHIDSKTTQALVKVISSLPLSESLSLSGFCENFMKELMETMLDNFAILKVRVLDLSNNRLGSMFASVMMRSVKCLPFLEKLDVRNNKLGSLGSVELLKLHGEVHVRLDNNGVEDSLKQLLECKEVVKKTGDLVEMSKQVKDLDDIKNIRDSFDNDLELNMSQASADNVRVLCMNLALFKNVVNLNLRQCNICTELGMVLAESCGHLLLLKYLDISSNQLGDDVIGHLGFKLPLLRNLRYANLHDTKITVKGIMSLLESVPEEQQKLVNVSHNLTTLKYTLPHIKDTVRHHAQNVDLHASELTLDKLKFVKDLWNV
ncbi:uncharacterized protein [Ptychodera flava]|uniref:uncharacterized protein n=1 Tax=Ptychodera flava TaxID=63121 RepID=UPI003969BD86